MKRKIVNLSHQVHQALDVFERTGKRNQFIALLDQVNAFYDEMHSGDMKVPQNEKESKLLESITALEPGKIYFVRIRILQPLFPHLNAVLNEYREVIGEARERGVHIVIVVDFEGKVELEFINVPEGYELVKK